MSNGLGESEWCFGNQMSLADISVGCALDYLIFRFPNIQWQKSYPNLNRLYKKLLLRPSFANTAPPQ
jgi:glutathione S-transferase